MSTENTILAVLDEMIKRGEGYLNVPPADGKMLRLLTQAAGAKNVVEIGTSTGYSGLWFSLAFQATGGKLVTFEVDAGRASAAREHFKKAGVDGLITIVQGDAHANVRRLKAPLDVVFIDADKEGYIDYLNKLLPLVRPSGLVLAHNVDMVPDYMKLVTTNQELVTVVYREGNGLAITLKNPT
jgi:predicted O-methyltransferase YrrM